MTRGRKTEYDIEIANKICELISKGESIVDISKRKDTPSRATIYKWLEENGEFQDMYVRAREARADYYAEQIINIADTAKDANLARVQIDARKWVASKLNARKYGDSTTVRGDGEQPVVVEMDVSPAKAAFLAAIAKRSAEE